MTEELTQARDCAGFVARDLRAALRKATPTETLVLLPLIGEAQRLCQDIDRLMDALAQIDAEDRA